MLTNLKKEKIFQMLNFISLNEFWNYLILKRYMDIKLS